MNDFIRSFAFFNNKTPIIYNNKTTMFGSHAYGLP